MRDKVIPGTRQAPGGGGGGGVNYLLPRTVQGMGVRIARIVPRIQEDTNILKRDYRERWTMRLEGLLSCNKTLVASETALLSFKSERPVVVRKKSHNMPPPSW